MIRCAGSPVPGPPARGPSPDPARPVCRADRRPLQDLARPRRRNRDRHQDDARVPRVLACDKGIDVMLGRWIADYDDPDNFTFTLFHSGNGAARAYFSSPETDRLLEEARGETRPAAREALYRRVRARAARPRDPRAPLPRRGLPDRGPPGPRPPASERRPVRQLRRARKGRSGGAAGGRRRDRRRNSPRADRRRRPDPRSDTCETLENSEVAPSLFETLTRAIDGTRIVPWIASEVLTKSDGRRYRFRLRPGVPFHDGRRADDARRPSLVGATSPLRHVNRWLLSPIRGAKRILSGETTDLEGFHIVSPSEFYIDLEKPVAFFPAVISYTPTAIVPEGTGAMGVSKEEGVVGTGPFRILTFDPGTPARARAQSRLLAGGISALRRRRLPIRRFSRRDSQRVPRPGDSPLPSDLLPGDAEAFRHDPALRVPLPGEPAADDLLRDLQPARGPFRDPELRRRIVRAIDVAGFVRRTIGRLALPAQGIIPPGLLGYSASGPGCGPCLGAAGAPTARSRRPSRARRSS